MTTPTFDPIQGKAAFDSLLPRYKAMSADSLATFNAADYLARAWTLLLDTYDEVATTGRWLLRRDPQADKTFPSLVSMVRTRRTRSKNKPDAPPAPTGG